MFEEGKSTAFLSSRGYWGNQTSAERFFTHISPRAEDVLRFILYSYTYLSFSSLEEDLCRICFHSEYGTLVTSEATFTLLKQTYLTSREENCWQAMEFKIFKYFFLILVQRVFNLFLVHVSQGSYTLRANWQTTGGFTKLRGQSLKRLCLPTSRKAISSKRGAARGDAQSLKDEQVKTGQPGQQSEQSVPSQMVNGKGGPDQDLSSAWKEELSLTVRFEEVVAAVKNFLIVHKVREDLIVVSFFHSILHINIHFSLKTPTITRTLKTSWHWSFECTRTIGLVCLRIFGSCSFLYEASHCRRQRVLPILWKHQLVLVC